MTDDLELELEHNETGNMTVDYSQDMMEHYQHVMIFRIFLEFYTLTSIVCIAADVFIIYCVLKYRRLRKARCNLILLNWCVGNVAFMLSSPLLFRVVTYTDISFLGYCLLEQLEFASLMCDVLMMGLMTVYWFLELHHVAKFEKFARHLNYYIICAYCMSLFYAGVSAQSCFNYRYSLLSHFVMFAVCAVYFVVSLIMDVAHLWKRRRLSDEERRRAASPFALSHIYYGSFYSFFVLVVMVQFQETLLAFTVVFCSLMLLVTATPLYFLLALYRCDRDFNVFFAHVLSCRCRSYAGDELLDERPVAFSNESGEQRC